jgi:N-acetylmuramoyl-L-alanine amidase
MQRRLQRIIVIFLTLGMAASAQAASISGVGIESGRGSEAVVFETDSAVTPVKAFTLDNPSRVVIDIPHARATGVMLPENYAGSLVANIRFGQFDAATSRLVIDLRAPVHLLHAGPEGARRLVVTLEPTGPVTAAAKPSPFAPIEPKPSPPPAPKGLPMIVIDAGHGGQDPGALGKHDTREKNVTLAMARAVKSGLLATGRYRVLLTREDDTYIPLQGRVDIARRAKADIFISLHADSNPKGDARGLSVYTLSETASDAEAQALADRENKADIIAGLDLDTADADVASILIDLTQRETMNKSALLADTVVKNLNPKIQRLESTHRFAGFRVLKAPDVPSLLIEMGFISNGNDEQLLTSADYRELFVASLIKALDAYEKN